MSLISKNSKKSSTSALPLPLWKKRSISLAQSIYSIGKSNRSEIRPTGFAYISFFAAENRVYVRFLYQVRDMWGNPVDAQGFAFKCKTTKQAQFLASVFNRIIAAFFYE